MERPVAAVSIMSAIRSVEEEVEKIKICESESELLALVGNSFCDDFPFLRYTIALPDVPIELAELLSRSGYVCSDGSGRPYLKRRRGGGVFSIEENEEAGFSAGDVTSAKENSSLFRCEAISVWKTINSHKYAVPFRRPVNSRDAPDYHKLVKKPVDLLSIRRQIEDGSVSNFSALLALFALLAANAMVFNGAGSEYHSYARELLAFSESQVFAAAARTGLALSSSTVPDRALSASTESLSLQQTGSGGGCDKTVVADYVVCGKSDRGVGPNTAAYVCIEAAATEQGEPDGGNLEGGRKPVVHRDVEAGHGNGEEDHGGNYGDYDGDGCGEHDGEFGEGGQAAHDEEDDEANDEADGGEESDRCQEEREENTELTDRIGRKENNGVEGWGFGGAKVDGSVTNTIGECSYEGGIEKAAGFCVSMTKPRKVPPLAPGRGRGRPRKDATTWNKTPALIRVGEGKGSHEGVLDNRAIEDASACVGAKERGGRGGRGGRGRRSTSARESSCVASYSFRGAGPRVTFGCGNSGGVDDERVYEEENDASFGIDDRERETKRAGVAISGGRGTGHAGRGRAVLRMPPVSAAAFNTSAFFSGSPRQRAVAGYISKPDFDSPLVPGECDGGIIGAGATDSRLHGPDFSRPGVTWGGNEPETSQSLVTHGSKLKGEGECDTSTPGKVSSLVVTCGVSTVSSRQSPLLHHDNLDIGLATGRLGTPDSSIASCQRGRRVVRRKLEAGDDESDR